MASPSLMVFTGNANKKLANDIARELGLPIGKAVVGRFSDGEVAVEITENIRGSDIYLVYNHLWDEKDVLLRGDRADYYTVRNTGIFKVDYTYRF